MVLRTPLLALVVVMSLGCPKSEGDGKTNDKSDKAQAKPEGEKDKDKSDKSDKSDKKKDDDTAKKDKPKEEEEPAKPVGPPPTCTVNAQKTWGKGVSTLTGLTAVALSDGKTAIGYAVGNTPQVLLVGQKGEGSIAKVEISKESTFAAKAPKAGKGNRVLWRVTPTKIEGKTAHAFVDFRDDWNNEVAAAPASAGQPPPKKSRRVVCGPADSGDKWVSFEGDDYFGDPAYGKDAPAALVNAKVLSDAQPYTEIRDCRTFYDAKKDETWIVGSEIRVTVKDGKAAAESVLFIEQGKQQKEVPLHKTTLKTDPWKLADYEVPVSHELANGTFLVAARIAGSALVAAKVEHDKTVIGQFKTYQGYFNMPDASDDGPDDVLMASMKTGKDTWALRSMRISGDKAELPAKFSEVLTDEDESHSESKPEFLRDSKGQRWVAYIENAEKGKGHLEIIPVSATFRSTGRPYAVTKEEEKASEAKLVAQKDGGFIVAYIRDAGTSGGELVTEDLDCKVEK